MPREGHGVTSFLQSGDEIMILLRSQQVSTYRGKWGGVSGAVDSGRTPDEQAVLEIMEETGLSEDDFELVKRGEPLIFDDEALNLRKVVHPYLFRVSNRNKIKIDWEHKELLWIKPEDIGNYDTMPKLKETLDLVL